MQNIDLANFYADQFRKEFAPEVLGKYQEYFDLLEQGNKKRDQTREKESDELFKRIGSNKKKAENKEINSKSVSSPTTENKDKEKDINKSETSTSTAVTNVSEGKVSKPSKRSWGKWIFGPILFLGAATSFFFLMRYRNSFRR